jgi:MFS family permease
MPSYSNASDGTTKWLALLAVCFAAAAMPLTFTGTAVALPSIGRALGGSPVAIAWVTNAFMLTFGSTLMAAGALADNCGRKRIFLAGVGSFAAFSLALVFAPDILMFDLLRAVQGLAAAAAFSGGMAALAQEFDGPVRLRAFSIVGTSFGVGLSLGPVASGLMIEAFGWRSIFLAVVIFAALAFALGCRALKESGARRPAGSTGAARSASPRRSVSSPTASCWPLSVDGATVGSSGCCPVRPCSSSCSW